MTSLPQGARLKGVFDFPCARVWRCGYSGEVYEPDAEEVRRAERLEANMEAILGTEYRACPYNVKYRTA